MGSAQTTAKTKQTHGARPGPGHRQQQARGKGDCHGSAQSRAVRCPSSAHPSAPCARSLPAASSPSQSQSHSQSQSQSQSQSHSQSLHDRPTTRLVTTAPSTQDHGSHHHGGPRVMTSSHERRSYVRKLSAASSGSIVSDLVDEEGAAAAQAETARRMVEAEKILEEIAKEFAAKRAAGLVPTKPVPARTLLWEEMARHEKSKTAKRGQCVFGRDTDAICGCTSYKKKRIHGQDNPGGICECCHHGAPWHRLIGGSMMRSSRFTRSVASSGVRRSSRATSSALASDMRSSGYEYDSEYDDDEEEDDEDIANEIAAPTLPEGYVPPRRPSLSIIDGGSRASLTSGLSSGTNSLGALLQAIQRYRGMGLTDEEIEERIREDFPPVPRQASITTSDSSFKHM